ncbi:hypothetical protein LXL04_018930 [Taraxacum kok-saghyz]
MSSMRFLNTLSKDGTKTKKTHETKGGSLMFVEAKVCGKNTKALVDSGATHSFMAKDEARKLGIPYVEEKGWLKVVNSPYNPILGVARGLPMKIADWEGTIDVIVVPMDDYRMVLGMDFLNKVCPWTIERDNTMRITKGSTIHIVPLERSRTKSRILATLKYEEGHMTGARPRRDADMTKEESPPKSSIGRDFPEATRRKYAKGKMKEKSDGGHVAPRRTRAGRDLDEDVKGLSGGGCHGRKFQTIPRHSRSQQTSRDDSGRIQNCLRRTSRSWKSLENYGACRSGAEESRTTFDERKAAVMSDPILKLPDFSVPFLVQTDASDFAIGGVLMQEGHPVAFESRKLNETERRYPVHDKEMTAIIHCLRVWRHYLLGNRFVIQTDNIATSYFQNQKKLSPKQARWQDFLAEFDYSMEYKPGKGNVVADALSRKANLATLTKITCDLTEKIKEGLNQDPLTQNLMKMAKEGKTRKFWIEDGLLLTTGNRMYVPKWNSLRRDILKECHDSKWAGHPGTHRTKALVERTYYWPSMHNDVEAYVKTCLVCQQDKVEQSKPAGLLEPLPVAERPWESVSLDFISALPTSEGSGSILVVVDRFSKYGTFIPAPKDCTAEEAGRLFFKHFVSANQRDWAKLLDVAQFSYNLQQSEATGRSPFELVTGQQPLTPQELTKCYKGDSPHAYKFIKGWNEELDIARSYLTKASKRMKKWADQKRQPREFLIGDEVMVKFPQKMFKSTRQVHKGLTRRYEGPYKVIEKVGTRSYKLDLPSYLKIHPVFHVSLLKSYNRDLEDTSRNESHRAPVANIVSFEKEVEEILSDRVMHKRGTPKWTEYYVKWKGLPDSESTWEREQDLWQFRDKIDDYKSKP